MDLDVRGQFIGTEALVTQLGDQSRGRAVARALQMQSLGRFENCSAAGTGS
jgi:hypothetical protein